MTTPRYIPGEGNENATFMIIGEAPGVQEELQGRPFIGASGALLHKSLERVGISDRDVYITNVCHYRPPGNKIAKFIPKSKKYGRNPGELVAKGLAELYKDIARICPKIIIPVGNVALWAVTGQEDISRRRGSIYATNLDTKRTMAAAPYLSDAEMMNVLKGVLKKKVIPTWNPAAVLRQYNLKTIFEMDLKKAVRESRYPELRLPQREIYVEPDEEDTTRLADALISSNRFAADIETPGNRLYCIGYSCDPKWALVLRFDQEWKRAIHRRLLSSAASKTFQNGAFDTTFLKFHEGIEVTNYVYDTAYSHKLIYPEFKQGLDFLTSFYTDEPYYKDEGKGQDLSVNSNVQQYMRYCGKDACITQEVWDSHLAVELKKPAIKDCVERHMLLLSSGIVTNMMVRGLNIDKKEMERIKQEKIKYVTSAQVELDNTVLQELLKAIETHKVPAVRKIAQAFATEMMQRMQKAEKGMNVNSNKDIMTYLYDIRGFKEKRNKITRARTADEKALAELYGETGDKSLLIMVKMRQAWKLLSSYLSYKFAPTGRFYYSVNPVGTKTQRWSSGQTIVVQVPDRKKKGKLTKTGQNAMTIPGEIRRGIIADKGYVLFYADLAGVEDRIVAYQGEVQRKIHCYENNIKAHALTASGIFGCTIEEVMEEAERMKKEGKTPPLYYMGKQSNHAFNYDEGPRTFMLNVNKKADETGIRITFAQAKQIRSSHFNFYPEIKGSYHEWIKEEIRRTRTLRNPFGYERQFLGRVPDDSTYRDGYSWYPQSTAPEIINRSMVRIVQELPEVEILLHVHDAILGQVPESSVEQIKPEILRLMIEPLTINNHTITIPVDIKFGERWSALG